MFHYYVLNHKGCMMLLNFDGVNELKQLKEALEYYKEYLFEVCCNNETDAENNKKLEVNKKLVQKIVKEIDYYDTSEQKD